ncbi:MAG TPA: hypothetical protein PLK22_00955 [Candidatus Paceibacterota bacterium]|nr:hypothetical protein [Candidatus Paceibacterota bacterium]
MSTRWGWSWTEAASRTASQRQSYLGAGLRTPRAISCQVSVSLGSLTMSRRRKKNSPKSSFSQARSAVKRISASRKMGWAFAVREAEAQAMTFPSSLISQAFSSGETSQ